MLDIITRGEANLPPVPSSVGGRSPESWRGIRVHHTAGAFSTWRAVHDWMTTGRPADGSLGARLVYIGYSFGIANGRVTELRGWDRVPAHDFINTHLGVVFGGNYQTTLPPKEDLNAFVQFLAEVKRRDINATVSTHREVNQTSCPGSTLHQWVKVTLPKVLAEGDDVGYLDWDKADRKAMAHDVVQEWIDRLTPVAKETDKAVQLGVQTAGERLSWKKIGQYAWGYPEYLVRVMTEVVIPTLRDIAAGIEGIDIDVVLARIDEHATASATRDAQMRELVLSALSGDADAMQTLRALAEILHEVTEAESETPDE